MPKFLYMVSNVSLPAIFPGLPSFFIMLALHESASLASVYQTSKSHRYTSYSFVFVFFFPYRSISKTTQNELLRAEKKVRG